MSWKDKLYTMKRKEKHKRQKEMIEQNSKIQKALRRNLPNQITLDDIDQALHELKQFIKR